MMRDNKAQNLTENIGEYQTDDAPEWVESALQRCRGIGGFFESGDWGTIQELSGQPVDSFRQRCYDAVTKTTFSKALALIEFIGEKLLSLGLKVTIGALLIFTIWTAKFGSHESQKIETSSTRSFGADIIDPHGNPLSHAEIVLVDRTHGKRQVLHPDQNGKIQTELQDDSLYEVQYPQSDGSTIRIKIPVGQSMALTLTLEPMPADDHPRTHVKPVRKAVTD